MEHDINAYMASRKKAYKMIKKYINNKKGAKQFSPKAVLDMGQDLKTITDTLKEAEAIGFSVLKSVMMLISGEKASSKAEAGHWFQNLPFQFEYILRWIKKTKFRTLAY
ncbi:UNVERIFIED_CONTAM: hypothetical protein Slati_2312900 [Sesamum latifolium]|uniref:Uncharacterized protein n=1 Tax=Sesamum latifolium TaxID=2727402 RepID=A0AAW2WAC6_9LAMI